MKVLHFTHIDGDALGCVVVANCIQGYTATDFKNYYIAASKSDEVILKTLLEVEEGNMEGSDELELVLITDIGINEDTARIVDGFVKKRGIDALLVDHHESDKADRYVDWAFVYPAFYKIRAANDHQNYDIFPIYDVEPVTNMTGVANMYEKKYSACWHMLFNKAIRDVLPLKGLHDFNFRADDGNTAYTTAYNCMRAIYLMITDISDYDTWAWKEVPDNTKDQDRFAILIKTKGFIDRAADMCVHSLMSTQTENPVEMTDNDKFMISSYREKRDVCIKRKMNNVGFMRWYEYNVGIILCTDDFINDELEAVYTSDSNVDIAIALFPESKLISLRTNKPDINVARIAERLFNGGGHKNAAGGKLKEVSEFCSWMSEYYVAVDKEHLRKAEIARVEKELAEAKENESVSDS